MELQALELLRQMFVTYGQEPKPERVAMYVETLGPCSASHLGEAIRDAMRETPGNFAPGPGTVMQHLRAIRRTRAGDPQLPETPRDTGPRLGAGDPTPALFSGIEARVERNYANVIRRAAEIRAQHALPETLDARLWSLGKAEIELGWRDQPYACRCNPPCGTRLDRDLKQQRDESERRLREAGYLRDAA